MLGLGGLAVLCGLPAALSTLGLLWYRFGRPPELGRPLPVSAGAWLVREVERRLPGLELQVHGAVGLDAYWPGVDAIGLSARTWHGRHPTDLAIAAHELGHALNVRRHPLAAQALPFARTAQGLAWRAFVATVVAAVLMGAPGLLPVASGILVVSIVVTSVVCLDEALASQFAISALRADPDLTEADLRVVRGSTRAAGAVYGLNLLGQLLVVAAWPGMVTLGTFGAAVGDTPGPVAITLAMLALPVLLLRAAQVGLQVWDPEPVTTDFRLFTMMHRESRWEFLTGLAVLAVVALLHPLLEGPLGTSVLVGAIMTAIGPVGFLLRALVLVPVVYTLRALGLGEDTEPPFASPGAEATAPALLALYTDPPWYLRVSWLASLAYLPFLGVLALRLCV